MKKKTITKLWPDELKSLLTQHRDSDYLLIDVRQPLEYQREHIPGAKLFSLKELLAAPIDLPRDKDLFFYCQMGMRSLIAAETCVEQGFAPQKLFSLIGGIAAWEETILTELPKVELFRNLDSPEEIATKAMDLEKGAYLFYSYLIKIDPNSAQAVELKKIAGMETSHAKLIYNSQPRSNWSDLSFEKVFKEMQGAIIENGQPLEEACALLESSKGEFWINALEVALAIEYSAYDLYRSAANAQISEESSELFLNLAQAEKSHISMLTRLYEH